MEGPFNPMQLTFHSPLPLVGLKGKQDEGGIHGRHTK